MQLFCAFVFRAFSPFTVDKVWVCSISVCIALQQEELSPWKIAECPLPTFTFKQFYEEKVGSKFSDRVLKQVFVGQTKESLDLVDCDLVIAEVRSFFGRYVNYNVEKEAGAP